MTLLRVSHSTRVPLRTSATIESPFAALRLRTDAAQQFKTVENATAVIWKLLVVVQGRFRRLHAPELPAAVSHGAPFGNGVRVMEPEWRVAGRLTCVCTPLDRTSKRLPCGEVVLAKTPHNRTTKGAAS